jgi:hypothetical protein
MKNQMLTALCFLVIGAITGQQPTAAPNAQPRQVWTEHYRNSTLSVGRLVKDAQGSEAFQVLGTAIIAALDQSHVYIVTAKHVFDDPSQSWHPSELRIRFAWQEKESLKVQHGELLKLTDNAGSNLWVPAAEGDLAAIALPDSFKKFQLHGIGIQDFPTEDDLYDGASVFVYGYPSSVTSLVGNESLVRAITRGGVVAWTDPSGSLEHPFLIDANVLPGNSGGPVFKVPTGMARSGSLNVGGKVAFLGIVSQDLTGWYAVQADGRMVQVKFPDLIRPANAQVSVTGIGGLGKVEPASSVRKLMESMASRSAHLTR